ncbi:CDP-glycerol glycerophosphotransferase family protein [Haloferula sp. A504]|uniref:CDP-glycerol glycerophosphotransferase family protein n=1 Tax=Haloferula sp. A504 TaxID=3373601 RepID=UPI0031C64217|nr:CDP-glycerol glycerophosphotransferase family protein [Verrucomicrobiaceae bacterium E54]
MRELLRFLFEWLHRWMPKANHTVIYGWPDGEDQSRALEQSLQATRLERVVLLLERPEEASWADGPKTRRVRKASLAGIGWFLRARYVFFSHPCFVRRFPANVVSVNCWHGMPIKKIGAMIENDEPIRCSHTLATSPFWGEIMQRTIMKPGGDILATGLPRNDRLFVPRHEVFEKLSLDPGQRLVLWLPTYRTSLRGLPREDGVDYGNAFGLPDADPEELNDFLGRHKARMVVKPHPMASTSGFQSWSHLKIIDDAWLAGRSVSLYELLGASAMLITDISSAVIDYLLLDRPVIHAFPDLDEYRASRGFTVEPIEDYLAGAVVRDQRGLVAALEKELGGDDPHAERRQKLLELSHQHRDGAATKRLLESIGL